MSLACGTPPDHSPIAALISSLKDAMIAIFSDMLLVCMAQELFGGPPVAFDGLQRPSNAAKAWSGPCDAVKQKQETLAAQVRAFVAQHETADQAGEGSRSEAPRSEPGKVHAPIAG
jgi:hypothetical protein